LKNKKEKRLAAKNVIGGRGGKGKKKVGDAGGKKSRKRRLFEPFQCDLVNGGKSQLEEVLHPEKGGD